MIQLTIPQIQDLLQPRGTENLSIVDRLETTVLPGKINASASTIVLFIREAEKQYMTILATLNTALTDGSIDQTTYDTELAEIHASTVSFDARRLPYDFLAARFEISPAVLQVIHPLLDGIPAPETWQAFAGWEAPPGVTVPGYPTEPTP